MGKAITTTMGSSIDCYREELLIYLVQRFGSLSFAQRIFAETQLRLASSNILDCVPNPHIYLISYALSLGLEFMQESNANKSLMEHKGQEPETATIESMAMPTLMTGGAQWHPQLTSILH
ncbi:MAG TPA: hypothetical protein VN030_05470 [Cellvibrio sp.]|nr:hypothetical protein [Cellvibrio sp.]